MTSAHRVRRSLPFPSRVRSYRAEAVDLSLPPQPMRHAYRGAFRTASVPNTMSRSGMNPSRLIFLSVGELRLFARALPDPLSRVGCASVSHRSADFSFTVYLCARALPDPAAIFRPSRFPRIFRRDFRRFCGRRRARCAPRRRGAVPRAPALRSRHRGLR